MKKIVCHDRGLNPGHPRDRETLYHVTIKADLYRKAVQEYHIPIPGDTLMYKVVHFASNLRLNRFCLVRKSAYLIKKINK